MPASPDYLLSQEQELALHQRLSAGDNTASADLAMNYLNPLIQWLRKRNVATIPDEMCITAAEDALLTLAKSPASFNPDLNKRLEVYLRMSAQGDLKNALQREMRHRQGRVSLKNVELSRHAGKYLRADDDPSLPMQIEEERDKANNQAPSKVRDGLTEAELRVLALMQQGERKTAAFAQALGIGQLPKEERETIVKRMKGKLKKRMERNLPR